jgi:Ca-activated chloride channel family protein
MPLPVDGAVLGYTVTIGGRVIRGEIEARGKAEARYREALYRGQTAGRLEQDRADTFLQRLGNVPAGTDVRVEIEMLQPLAFAAGDEPAAGGEPGEGREACATGRTAGAPHWVYHFPTVVGVRYQGSPGRVPDAGRLDVDRDAGGGIPARFGLHLTVADGIAGSGGVTSSSHAIVAASAADGTPVRLAEDARLDRDVVVRWTAAKPEVGVRIVEGRGAGSDDGRYALVTITPPAGDAAAHARDLTVLLDASGSMQGGPIAIAKDVIESLLQSLGAEDRFEVLAFSNHVRRVTRGLLPAEQAVIRRAVRDVRAIHAGGGTEMAHALGEALRPLRGGSQRQVVLVTDGDIGFVQEVIAKARNMPAGVRVNVVGIGPAPNRSLTRFLARAGRGVELLANDDAGAAECATRLRTATARPVLTEVRFGGTAVLGVAPAKPRDVLAGQPLVLAVELRPRGGTLEVSGQLAGSKSVWAWRVEVPAAGAAAGETGPAIATTPLPVGALYGREAIADLEAEAGSGDADVQEVDGRIEALGLRHRITSRRTSLVAICEEPATDPNAPRRREKLVVELPAGISAEGVGLFEAAPMAMLGWGPPPQRFMELLRVTRGDRLSPTWWVPSATRPRRLRPRIPPPSSTGRATS